MQDNTENLPYFYLEFQDPRTGSLITKTLPMTHEGMEQMKELDKLTEQHNEEFNTLFNSLCPQFDERLSAIGGWIAHKYDNILPTKKEFIEWFIRTKIGTYKIIPHYSINDNEEYLQEHLEYIDFWFPDYENTFIPNLIDDYLLEYCQEYVNGLELKKEKIFQQLSTPDHVEDGKAVKVPQQEYKNLPDLFNNKEDFDFAISVLKNVEKPVIGEGNNYLLGKNSKGAFVAWIDLLHKNNFIKTKDESIIKTLLESYFINFTVTDRTLRNTPTEAYNKYYTDFKVLYSNR